MHALLIILILACTLFLLLSSYVHRLYGERGRFVIRGSKDNVEFFEEQIEPALKLGLNEGEPTFALLVQVYLIVLALLVLCWDLGQPLQWPAVLQAGLFLILDAVLFAQVIPNVLLTRTSGRWLQPFRLLLRLLILSVRPLVMLGYLLHHITTLGVEEPAEPEAPSAGENIEALMMVGEEEGLIEKEDRRLIRSVVEFGDKTVREVMTPRPEMFAVPVETTLQDLRRMLAEHPYSRVPVFEADLDHIIGFVKSLDLFLESGSSAAEATVRELLRSVPFVPETKSIAELLREIQQKAQIAIVVDEYGSVAGLVTVEDMVEEIVGEIRDEHDAIDAVPQGEGVYSVPGSMDPGKLEELFGVRLDDPNGAATVSGLVTGILGRVPIPGERLERDGLVLEVTESNGRRVLRLLVRRATAASAASKNPPPSVGRRPGAG